MTLVTGFVFFAVRGGAGAHSQRRAPLSDQEMGGPGGVGCSDRLSGDLRCRDPDPARLCHGGAGAGGDPDRPAACLDGREFWLGGGAGAAARSLGRWSASALQMSFAAVVGLISFYEAFGPVLAIGAAQRQRAAAATALLHLAGNQRHHHDRRDASARPRSRSITSTASAVFSVPGWPMWWRCRSPGSGSCPGPLPRAC